MTGHAHDELLTSGAVELFVTRAGASRLQPLGLEDAGSASDPWPTGRHKPNGAAIPWSQLSDKPGDDALDRAFREAERADRQRHVAMRPTASRVGQ